MSEYKPQYKIGFDPYAGQSSGQQGLFSVSKEDGKKMVAQYLGRPNEVPFPELIKELGNYYNVSIPKEKPTMVFEVTISYPDFTEYLMISKKRAVKPFKKGSKKAIPLKYQTDAHAWDAKDRLIDERTGEVIASNPQLAGKPRMWRINGQDLYNAVVGPQQRKSIMEKLHALYEPYFNKNGVVGRNRFPLQLFLDFYILDNDTIKDKTKNLDNDNKWIWEKFIQDCMVSAGLLPVDEPWVINDNRKRTNFVTDARDVKLVIQLITA